MYEYVVIDDLIQYPRIISCLIRYLVSLLKTEGIKSS
jgi:hypothetical protein